MALLRELHREHQPLVSPLAHDALSARLIERAGFKTFNIGGSAQVAYPNILIGRVAKAVEHGLQRLGQLAAGKDNAFTNGEQEMALKSLADAVDLQKWKELEKKYS
jgi:2-methylisocitrate lyase-like PEP mutase family enzyme